MATTTTTGIDASKYIDFSYFGNVFSSFLDQTNTLIVKGPEAIKNTIKLYLMSQKGDYGRDVIKGGPMISIIGKPLTDSYKAIIESRVKEAVSTYSSVVVTNVNAVADIPNMRWVVHVSFTDVYHKRNNCKIRV